MFSFITCLRHPATVKSMPQMLALLERTLSTIEAQTNQDFTITIVCHEIPALSRTYPHVEFIIVDIPPPAQDFNHIVADLELVRLDKGRKYLAGLYHVRPRHPSHVMFFDADDCLSPHIVETVLSGPRDQSWYVGEGYIYAEGSRWIVYRKDDFHTHCGTCYMFDERFYADLPADMSEVSEEWMKNNLGSHRLVHEYLAQKGIVLKQIPYPAVVYIINTGENHSGLTGYARWVSRRGGIVRFIRFILKIRAFRRLSEEVKREFQLEDDKIG